MRSDAFDLQPQLQNEMVRLQPLQAGDFEALYAVASDPRLWEQHPNRNRWQREVFQTFFQGAMASRGALSVHDRATGDLIGTSRYYDFDPAARTVAIGYTFIARRVWGRQFNRALKALMLEHAFRFVDRVVFHVGVDNVRSRKAVEKLGGVYVRDVAMAYYGEPSRDNAVYTIDKSFWTG